MTDDPGGNDRPTDEPAIVAGFRRVPPPGPLPDSDPVLVARLRDEIRRSGPITFARFMEVALYDPERGYYGGSEARPGRAGDFLTAPESHPIFGRTLARVAGEVDGLLGSPDRFTLIEYGSGSGALAVPLLEGIRTERPDLLARLRFVPVERSTPRVEELVARLAAAGLSDRLERQAPDRAGASDRAGAPVPAAAPESAAGSPYAPEVPAPAAGLVLANELLDALPVHSVVGRSGAVRELLVGWDEQAGRFVDVEAEPTTPLLAARLAADGVELAEGGIGEICLGLAPWLADVARRLARGIVVAIDYGHEATDLYGPARRGGTLRAYLRHMVADDPYAHVGRQDLTAHVDLTALVREAADAGFRHLGTTTQAAFLVGSGIGELLERARVDPAATLAGHIALRSALGRLLDPAATGGYRVVVLGRGIPPDATLAGLAAAPEGRRTPRPTAPDDAC